VPVEPLLPSAERRAPSAAAPSREPSGWTTGRYLHGIRRRLQAVLLGASRGTGQLDCSRAAIDTQMCALRGSPNRPGPGRPRPTGPEAPCDRPGARNPSGGPLVGGSRNNVTQLNPLPEAIWAVRDGCRGSPHPSQRLDPDRGYETQHTPPPAPEESAPVIAATCLRTG
jgi:hypothetical protein